VVVSDPVLPSPPVEPVPVPPPSFLSAAQPAESNFGKWIGWIVLLMLIAAVGGGVYITRAAWLPLIQSSLSRSQTAATPSTEPASPGKVSSSAAPPLLDLSAMEHEGQIEIRWNQQAAAILEATRGRLTIEDGGPPLTLDLDPPTLRTGAFTYKRKTERVDIGLTVFRPQLPNISEKRTFLGTLPGEFDPQSGAADPALGADKATRAEIDQLREALGRQVSRNRELENTVKQLRKQLDQGPAR
jgi:hypothetical protein